MKVKALQEKLAAAIASGEITEDSVVTVENGFMYAVKLGRDSNGILDLSANKWYDIGRVSKVAPSFPIWCKDCYRPFRLKELIDVDVDSWCDAICALSELDELRKEVAAMVGQGTTEDAVEVSPMEYADEFTVVAERYDFRFAKNGKIVSYNLQKGKTK